MNADAPMTSADAIVVIAGYLLLGFLAALCVSRRMSVASRLCGIGGIMCVVLYLTHPGDYSERMGAVGHGVHEVVTFCAAFAVGLLSRKSLLWRDKEKETGLILRCAGAVFVFSTLTGVLSAMAHAPWLGPRISRMAVLSQSDAVGVATWLLLLAGRALAIAVLGVKMGRWRRYDLET